MNVTTSTSTCEDGRERSVGALNPMSESSTIDIRAPCLAVLEPTDTFVSNSHENSQGNFSNSSSPTIEAGSSQSHMETLNVPVSEELLSPARQDEPEDVFHATDFRSFTRRTLNWIGQFFDENSTYRRQALWPIIFFSFIYVGACIVASVTILCLTWNKPCDEPLKYWVLFNGVISLLYTIFKRLSNEDLVDDYSQLTSIQQRSLICFRIISWLSLAWFIVGMVWVFRCETCQRTAVALYRLSLALVIINLIFLGVSVLLACCIFVLAPNLFRPDFNLDGSVTFHRRGATKKEIDRILLVRYHRDSSEEESTCPICLCEYEEGNLLRILPCTSKHRFHATCVDRWLILNKSCPLCKAEIDASSRCAGGTSRSDNV